MLVCGLRLSLPFISLPHYPSRRPSTRILRAPPTSYFCNNRECTHANSPQAASGRFVCQGTLAHGTKCKGTYRVSRWDARTYERSVRARWAAEDMQRAARSRPAGEGEKSSEGGCGDERRDDSVVEQERPDAVSEHREERRRIREVLDAWYRGDDAFLVAYVKSVGRSWMMSGGQKRLWLGHIQELTEREADLTAWLTKVDASCAGEEPWSP
ncbi:uncharacterized protein PHACADRAFT_207407 [Phanerochaete carnosa HHB-10118-sp]|uniref:Uncharacterized protein n=1 Tax=Phanerochaete carnosa (strain HHB-10118-sp) TaxID=650164 RepID=K5V756_PHACS|nr:uncharacterized protein PHACADRAFT_207407 [Phanerochaete carnosa HHB-10118-sp]EKM58591.1 hypothetical protein PHACADRAFT_207407 [Phanerochaete carnosa HHB-10118-sp]